jgi:tRNA wybutosine-synthesizing protein 3
MSLESLIGIEHADGRRERIVSTDYLTLLVGMANERFAENQKRIDRFRTALSEAIISRQKLESRKSGADKAALRELKRAEGLRRQEEVRKQKQSQEDAGDMILDLDGI